MLATTLVRSLCLTFRSPNPRISQGWEGKEPASAGFLLAVVWVCYAQDKINKSYQLDTTMKINEIASKRLDEAPPGVTPAVKYVGPYFDKTAAAAAKLFGAGKGTTQAELDALRAGETGAAKSGTAAADRAHSTVSSDELNALLHPTPSPEPTVASWLKRRGDPGFDPDLSKTQALPNYLQNMPPARIGPVTRPSTSRPHPRPATQGDLGTTEPELGLDTAASRDIGQIRPGVETPAASTSGEPAYTMSQLQQMRELFRTNPAAAEEQAKKWGLPAKIALSAAGVGALAGLPTAINAVRPGTVPDEYNPVAYVTKGPKEVLAPRPLPPSERIPSVVEPETDRGRASSTAPNAPAPVSPDTKARSADEIPDDDPRVQELMRQLEKNRKVDESTAALDRMIYLSRL